MTPISVANAVLRPRAEVLDTDRIVGLARNLLLGPYDWQRDEKAEAESETVR